MQLLGRPVGLRTTPHGIIWRIPLRSPPDDPMLLRQLVLVVSRRPLRLRWLTISRRCFLRIVPPRDSL